DAVTVWDAATGRRLLGRTGYRSVLTPCIGWRADGGGVALGPLADRAFFVSAVTHPGEKLPKRPLAGRATNWVAGPSELEYPALSLDATRLAVVRDPAAKQLTIDVLPATVGRPVAALKPERTLGPFPGPCREIRFTAGGRLVLLTGPWEA